MKTKKFLMLLAVVLLGSASAFAQSGSINPQNGDVNGDGVVDIADVVAVLGIMKDGGGTATVDDPNYYFYVGLTKPTSSTVIFNVVTGGNPGWHLIGDSLSGININNKAHDSSNPSNMISVEPTYTTDDGVDYYIVIPTELSIYDGLGNNITSMYTNLGNVEIQGHTYKILKDHDFEFIFSIY
jgi:hypothetical protein